jgi:hypothetical protein
MPRRRRPAAGQMTFAFVVERLPLELDPTRPPPAPPLPGTWWRRRRGEAPESRQERAGRGDDWTTARFIRRGARCALCRGELSHWPAPIRHRIGRRLLLLCPECSTRPEAPARLAEIVSVDWERSREEC